MATCSRCPNQAIARSHKPYPQFHETGFRLQERRQAMEQVVRWV